MLLGMNCLDLLIQNIYLQLKLFNILPAWLQIDWKYLIIISQLVLDFPQCWEISSLETKV